MDTTANIEMTVVENSEKNENWWNPDKEKREKTYLSWSKKIK